MGLVVLGLASRGGTPLPHLRPLLPVGVAEAHLTGRLLFGGMLQRIVTLPVPAG